MAARLHDNAVRWRPEDDKGHVESFFLKANDPGTDRAFWLKFTLYAPLGSTGGEGAEAEVWAILFDGQAGNRAVKQSFPLSELEVGDGGVGLSVGGCRFAPGHTEGTLHDTEGRTFSWALGFDGDREPLHPLPYEWMYTAPFPKSKLLTPTSNTRYQGHVEAGERRFDVTGWPGMQGHNWGRLHAERYAWGHCNLFVDEQDQPVEAVFEGFSGKIKLGPMQTPFLTSVVLAVRGKTYEFIHPAGWFRNSTTVEYTGWDFVCRRGPHRLLGSLWTSADQMVGLTYRNPAGDHTHCLNSKIAHAELRLVERGETLLRLRSPGKAALEVTVREPEHGVRMVL